MLSRTEVDYMYVGAIFLQVDAEQKKTALKVVPQLTIAAIRSTVERISTFVN
jgi:hypothetical protein